MSYKQNILRCVVYGVGGGAGFVIWVVVLYLLRGPEPFENIGIGLVPAIIFYLAGGATAGLIVGLLWPIAKQRVGAYLVSLLTSFVLSFGMGIQLSGNPVTWDYTAWLTLPIMTLVFGLAFGNSIWKAASGR